MTEYTDTVTRNSNFSHSYLILYIFLINESFLFLTLYIYSIKSCEIVRVIKKKMFSAIFPSKTPVSY